MKDPFHPVWVGGYNVGNGVNQIRIHGDYGFLVSPNSEELTILSLSDKAHPSRVGGFHASDGIGNGKSMAIVGNSLYLGRTTGGRELSIIDITNKNTSPLPQLGTMDLGGTRSANGFIVREQLGFILSNNLLDLSTANG